VFLRRRRARKAAANQPAIDVVALLEPYAVLDPDLWAVPPSSFDHEPSDEPVVGAA
jgi:hypothetical protein